ncbi:Tho complex subunit 7-domain-containing protein [Hypoxylon fragiforme]|uniref:Tho complex subunit 7-domain-containing protein n=1 Tax=Hypoxylon fragiforme TaxID=63214 RepID=UPI0020C5DE47|nr:Tho complex subunit 7-domain-containing protein [Hypoxylon fragiforme]KAI2613694.1 Tho complex subunit 7-domain-containing protein [Hypoxylon fragiforme]
MATQNFGLLDERDENELHKTRLLNVEEKPFKRITKRLVAPGAFTNPSKLPTPPPDSSNEQEAAAAATSATDINALKEDIILDFEAFDAQMLRLQLLSTANTKERERYAAERVRILKTMEEVRDGNGALRTRLDEARATLEVRRQFDVLANAITNSRMLRPRDEQAASLAKLAEECEDLHRESETYGATWRDRREQFGRLVDEGKRLRALIRDEKEEVERREGMDSDAEDGEAGNTPGKGGLVSGNATPRAESGVVSSKSDSGGGNNADSPGGGAASATTPAAAAAVEGGGGGGLKPRLGSIGSSFSRSGSQAPSLRAGSQQPKDDDDELEEGEDVEMADTPMAEASQDTPQITVEAPGDMDTT